MRESVARTFKQIVCFIKGKLQGNGECYYCRLLGRVPFDRAYDTEVNEDGSVLSGKIGIEYVDAPNIFPVTWKNGEVSECIFAFG